MIRQSIIVWIIYRRQSTSVILAIWVLFIQKQVAIFLDLSLQLDRR